MITSRRTAALPRRTLLAWGALLCLAPAVQAQAPAWPTKAITVVVPWPPAGPSDIAARPLAKGLQDLLGQPVVIENKAGAGGNVGTAAVVQAPADGYTLLVTSSAPVAINASLYKKMPFDAAKDLQPLTNVLRMPLVLVTHPGSGVNDLAGLLAQVRSKPEGMVIANSGNGTPQHLTAELFRDAAKLKLDHVPYKGSAPAIADVLAGHVPMMFDSLAAIMPHIKSGKVKPLAVTGAKRSPLLPNVPTMAEAGVQGVESYAWYGFFAKAGTPQPVVDKLNATALQVMKSPEFQRVLAETGSEYVGDTPAHFAQFVKTEAAKWDRIVKQSGATID
ncbi:tripartite-type tricarboxylate transporter receptor subunit TctC [Sphaerotilus hippei]|uniref:Tripartite-type tricarboxylate transporter receptor subunit TctC n=1 Tax=Sphaerotilus hippei TaxID=744406 RepID=A0A318H8S3_9BURK|nr:tripartite tricarboxylate transporter substrate binding protein [Sphaerotilus hippei]PXW96273.1 tripartite-type tricarboxylate transporter receptor subunit TctC [Sphaerotilus hippei]